MSFDAAVERLRAQLAAQPTGARIRLAKKTSNLFRPRARQAGGLDIDAFGQVFNVDVVNRTADVGGMTTYEDLVDATLPHGLVPLVVPELKTITLGGAVTGLGIESTSFRNGMPHESVIEMDVLTGDGQVLTARRDNEHRELFFGFPNSYGSLGYALRLRIELEPTKPFVHLQHHRFHSAADTAAAIEKYVDEPIDFLDGTVFSPTEIYLTVGAYADDASHTSDYTRRHIYYESIRNRSEDFLTVRDYIWRWDTDWFWCSRAFGAQNRWLRPLLPTRVLRSDVYWKLVALDSRTGFSRRRELARRRPPREAVIQDIEVPVDRLAEFLEFFDREIGIRPVWLCPLRQRDPDATWDLYKLDPKATYVNVGFWSSVAQQPGRPSNYHNRLIEQEVERLGGRKSLYSTSYYDEDEFWRLYGGDAYWSLKRRYDPDSRLLNLYEKCVRSR